MQIVTDTQVMLVPWTSLHNAQLAGAGAIQLNEERHVAQNVSIARFVAPTFVKHTDTADK